MSVTVKSCFICGGPLLAVKGDYIKCGTCGHELLVSPPATSMIVNDRLDASDYSRLNVLDRFKNRILRQCCRSDKFLIDIGSGTGRFLYQNRRQFRKVAGIEVTPECILFSRGLGLEIVSDMETLSESPSVVTFWHSLEHLPGTTIGNMLAWVRRHATPETVIIVSVPNADSLQARLFCRKFAYYDVPHHRHQFTLESLDRLMNTADFERTALFQSMSYSTFGWLQGMLNIFNCYHDYSYYRWKRGLDFGLGEFCRRLLDAYNLALILLLALPSLVLALLDAAMLQHGGVVTGCYRPKTLSK